MALIRCTCIYRTATDNELAAGRSVLRVEFPDPWCPAGHVHSRAEASSRPGTGEDAA